MNQQKLLEEGRLSRKKQLLEELREQVELLEEELSGHTQTCNRIFRVCIPTTLFDFSLRWTYLLNRWSKERKEIRGPELQRERG